MNHEQELEAKQRRRLERWYKSLPPDAPKMLTLAMTEELQRQGLLDEDENLTPAGELKLHQLSQLEWMWEQANPGKKMEVFVQPDGTWAVRVVDKPARAKRGKP